MQKDNADVTVEDIDNILDEIEENEEKTSANKSKGKESTNRSNWREILKQLQNGNSNFIKSLITSKDIDIDEKDPSNGKTLLIYVTIIGNYDLVKLVCNYGANVRIRDKDGLDALDYSKRYARYAITELLFYRQLSGTLGNDLKDIASSIYDKNEEAKRLKANDTEGYDGGEYSIRIYDTIIKAMICAIEKRDPFSPDLLYYAWYFYMIKCKDKKQDPLATEEPETKDEEQDTGYYRDQYEEEEAKRKRRKTNDAKLLSLWRVMMKTYEAILCNTSDKKGWEWLKTYFVNSLIWYLPHPNNTKSDDDEMDNVEDGMEMEYILQQTLFYELLTRVRTESKKQSDLLLKGKIDQIKNERGEEWNTLVSYHVDREYSSNARQDVCGCIEPKYTKDDLNERLYPPSTHFSAQKHYDTNMYLNELLFRANIVDTLFQFDMKKITNEINSETGFDAVFRAGPTKTLLRSQTKVENDYIDEDYPTAAKILDLNRCAIQFKGIDGMMKYIEIFTNKIDEKQAYSIMDIIRCKNGWSIYNAEQPAYTDIKLNVLVQSPNGTIVAEIQLLLKLMSSFKKKAHKLYSVERKFEMVYNFNKLQKKMSKFKDIYGHEGLMIDLIQKNEFESFKTYWLTITNEENLTHAINALVPSGTFEKERSMRDMNNPWKVPLFYLIMDKNGGDIYAFLVKNYANVLYKALETYLGKYYDIGYKGFFTNMKNDCENKDEITMDELALRFMERIYHFTSGASQSQILVKLLTMSDKNKASIASGIARVGTLSYETEFCPQSFKYIVENQSINADDKLSIFGLNTAALLSALKHKYLNHISEILFYFNSANNKRGVLDVLTYTPKSNSAKTGFLYICGNETDKRSLLPFILNNSMLDKEEKSKLISLMDDTIYTAFEQSLKTSAMNTQLILHYIRDTNIIMSWITPDICEEKHLKSESTLALLKQINNDKEKLMHLLGKLGLFPGIMNTNRVKLLQYILFETCLTSKDIMTLITSKCLFDYPKANGKNCGTEIIRYFKNDKESLMQILETVYETRSLFKMLYHNYRSNETRQILFTDSPLTQDDIYRLLQRNEKGIGCGDHDHDFGPKKETTFFKLVQGYHGLQNTVDLMDYLPTQYAVNLLLQEHTEEKVPYIAKLDKENTLHVVYSKLKITFKNNQATLPLLNDKILKLNSNANLIASQYEEYVKFYDEHSPLKVSRKLSAERPGETELDANMFEDIKERDNPLGTACMCGDHEIIQAFLTRYVSKKNAAKLFKVLNKPHIINKVFCNKNKNEINIKILRMLILDIEVFSEQQKFDIIHSVTPVDDKDSNEKIITPAFISTNNALRLEVLTYFEKQQLKKYILQLLQEKVSWGRNNRDIESLSPMVAICKNSKIPPVDFIINCSLLTDDEKVNLFDDSFMNIVKLNKGLSVNIVKYLAHNRDKKALMHFLSKTDDKTSETVLMLMMKTATTSAKDADALIYILESDLLNYEEKRKLVFEDVYTFPKDQANSSDYWGYGPFQTVFALSCKHYHNTQYIEKIFEYFNVEKDGNFAKTDDILTKIETADHLKVVLKNINDNELMRKLFSTKSQDVNAYGKTVYEICQEYAPSNSFSEDKEPQLNRNLHKFELIHKYQDYLILDAVLNEEKSEQKINITFDEYTEYWTNPWITCCEFGKMESMMKLIHYVSQIDDDKYTKLKSLLTSNYDLLNGNDWIMTLFDNGYKEMIISILQQLEIVVKDTFKDIMMSVLVWKNTVSNKTFLMMICDNENNQSLVEALLSMVKQKDIITKVLNCKDDEGNTCLDYAKGKMKTVVQTFLK